ncbi:MAG TPA: acetate--CoA ligase family protein [Negativicutes bacterium]|nr:acetate--CoA ligase family protein [Negativicutes bacterium]
MPEDRMVMMPEPEAIKLLASYGIGYPAHGVAHTVEEAVRIAEQIGYPVVMKVISPQIVHKSDAGGVRVNLDGAEAVSHAFHKISQAVAECDAGAEICGMLVCRQEKSGLELVVGKTEDEVFGPVLMFGLGGVFVEVLKDVAFRICPIGKPEALRMINEIKGRRILQGARGSQPLDVEAVADLLVRMSTLVAERKDITEVDLNPVRVYENGLAVLDVRVIRKQGVYSESA